MDSIHLIHLLLCEWSLHLLQPTTEVLIEITCRSGPRTDSSRTLLKVLSWLAANCWLLHIHDVLCPSFVFINPKCPSLLMRVSRGMASSAVLKSRQIVSNASPLSARAIILPWKEIGSFWWDLFLTDPC